MQETDPYPEIEARRGLVVLHRSSRFRGTVVRIDHDGGVVLRSVRQGTERVFSMRPGAFAVNGETATLIRPRPPAASGPMQTPSGSVPVKGQAAQVAKASRI